MSTKPLPSAPPSSPSRPRTKRCSFSLPAHLVSDLVFISETMGVSQSAILSQIAGDSISALSGLLRGAGSDLSSPDVVRRLRGDSVRFVQDEVSKFMSQIGEGASHDSH